jgi:hypothetical protein
MGNLPSLNPKIHGLRTNTKVPCGLFDGYSNPGRQKLGGLANQGKPLLQFSLGGKPGPRRTLRSGVTTPQVGSERSGEREKAVGRKLGIRLWIILWNQIDYH